MTMNMPKKQNYQDNQQDGALKVIEKIKAVSDESECIYRGEPKDVGVVSSSLYREFDQMDVKSLDFELIQNDMIDEAKQYLYKKDDLDILAELQHYGGKTNLIDFTTNPLIALFFACYGASSQDGRVIVQNTETIEDWILTPKNPRHRVSNQKIVFVQPPQGFIEPDESQIITIPAKDKKRILQHLRAEHNISTGTVLNDLYSLIRKQEIHRDAYIQYYSGLSWQKIGSEADTIEKQKAAYAEAIECYTHAIELKPDFLRSYKNRGIVYSSMDDADSAIEDFNTVIQLDPNSSTIYFYRGAAYFMNEELDKALDDFNKEINTNPTNFLAYLSRGFVSTLKGNSDQSIKDFSTAIGLNPNYSELYDLRGKLYAAKGEPNKAIKDFNKAIELKPEDNTTYRNRGLSYAKIDDYESAIQDFTKAVELNPEYDAAYYNRGNAYTIKGEYESAIQDLSKAIELNPQYNEAYYNRGNIYANQGDFESAIQDYDKAIELNPADDRTYHNRGIVYASKNDYDRAVQDFGKVIELDPEDGGAYCNRGECWLHLQEWEKAKSDLTTAKNIGYDIIGSFQNDYENVKDFEKKNSITLPEDIAAMLTQPQQ